MYKKYYRHFLSHCPNLLHFACHSHHFWPDVSRAAHLRYWDDSARLADEKWELIFSEQIPKAQRYIAQQLKISHPEQIVFASNTHELIFRLFSCLPFIEGHKTRILTSDSEFYSARRQLLRLQELNPVEVAMIDSEPFYSFSDRFCRQLEKQNYHLVFLSRVFFNSGVHVPDWEKVLDAAYANGAIVAIDDYHGFFAIPIDLSAYQDKVYYLAGNYKYAQGGEGACFLYSPPNSRLRPVYTGWFADFAGLEKLPQRHVDYDDTGLRFAGATMDCTAIYRFNAVADWLKQINLDVAAIHAYVQQLQRVFIGQMERYNHPLINMGNLIHHNLRQHGHFFAFSMDSQQQAQNLRKGLRKQQVMTDARDNRLRFGFALYQDQADIEELFMRLANVKLPP
ncbi:MAG: aminotransferase class V-fold PLP-dependent enzyme [Leptolyngbyaceae cyanobacterium MO_188.B28]|nr:aminotransferase class V-fold PLP-dependent enzyme [Leptolyngbyaceae cyanobacterium MO_188.B28]